MCDKCSESKFICPDCGAVLDGSDGPEPYICTRKDLKNLIFTSRSDCFVWILRFNGVPIKVGYGPLIKLFNETRPNANYVRFDTVIIYWLPSVEERNIFACRAMGEIDGIVNRRGVPNRKYKSRTEMRWRITGVSPAARETILGDPAFYIGETPYWDISELEAYGVS